MLSARQGVCIFCCQALAGNARGWSYLEIGSGGGNEYARHPQCCAAAAAAVAALVALLVVAAAAAAALVALLVVAAAAAAAAALVDFLVVAAAAVAVAAGCYGTWPLTAATAASSRPSDALAPARRVNGCVRMCVCMFVCMRVCGSVHVCAHAFMLACVLHAIACAHMLLQRRAILIHFKTHTHNSAHLLLRVCGCLCLHTTILPH